MGKLILAAEVKIGISSRLHLFNVAVSSTGSASSTKFLTAFCDRSYHIKLDSRDSPLVVMQRGCLQTAPLQSAVY
jgi:hypothetical protein